VTAVAPNASATYAELWTSFASLLRSYSAAHGLSHAALPTVEVTSECIVLRGQNRWLEITHHESEASWQREDGSGASFHLRLNGHVAMNEGEEEMDAVAERLAREIMQ